LTTTANYGNPSPNNENADYVRLQYEWAGRRKRVLDCLGEAKKGEARGGEKIESSYLEDCTLVVGDQTVKAFDSWMDWVSNFQDWLDNIKNGLRPCASFLFPHHYFGPDIVFALCNKDKKIVLCSIQVSKSMP
jgi:hypothetical protein